MSDQPTPSRRDFLQSIGIGSTTPVLNVVDEGALYQCPPAGVPQSKIYVQGDRSRQITTNECPIHWFGLYTEGDEGTTALDTVRDAASYTFILDSTEVTDFQRGWTDIEEDSGGRYMQNWLYPISPLPLGRYQYELTIEFAEPVQTSGNPDRVWYGDYQFTGEYIVTPAEQTQTTQSQRHARETDFELENLILDSSPVRGGQL